MSRLPLATIALALVAVGLLLATGARSAPPGCRSARQAAAYYRTWTWRWQDEAQTHRDLSGYRPGHRVRSCARARALARSWHRRARYWRLTVAHLNSDIPAAIDAYFGSEAEGAKVVAHCESGTHLTRAEIPDALRARNGWYGGIFQLGDSDGPVGPYGLVMGREIQQYGAWRGRVRYLTVIDQVAAAARMQRARSWSAWSCRPDGSIAY